MDRDDIFLTAAAMADAARGRTLPLFRSPGLAPDNKLAAGFDPVTEADRDSERAMRAILADSPKLAILADGICDLAERGHARRDEGLLRGAINAARSIGRRVRRQAARP